jgi:peroxiredoxin
MAARAKPLAIAAAAGVLAAGVIVIGTAWIDDEPDVDGTFVLEEPGIYDQPNDDVNDDSTGRALPARGLVDVDGAPVDLTAAIAGTARTPMVINLWFSRCAPCRRELVDFAAVHGQVGSDVRFVGVDPFDSVTAMQEFADERGVTYELLRDPERTFSNDLGVVGYPVTLFVDADGRIVRQTGEIDADGLRDAIGELFDVPVET